MLITVFTSVLSRWEQPPRQTTARIKTKRETRFLTIFISIFPFKKYSCIFYQKAVQKSKNGVFVLLYEGKREKNVKILLILRNTFFFEYNLI